MTTRARANGRRAAKRYCETVRATVSPPNGFNAPAESWWTRELSRDAFNAKAACELSRMRNSKAALNAAAY